MLYGEQRTNSDYVDWGAEKKKEKAEKNMTPAPNLVFYWARVKIGIEKLPET